MADGAACTATDRTLVEVLVELIDRHPTNPRNLPREDEPALRLACADIIGTMQVEAGAASYVELGQEQLGDAGTVVALAGAAG